MTLARSSWIVLSLLLLVPSIGCPHAYLVKSAPARRAVLLTAPAQVQLWFNERLVSSLPSGTYTVKFRVLSVDGHIVKGEYPFTIRGSQ